VQNKSTVLLAGYSILTSKLGDIDLDSKCVINTVNQYSFIIAENDLEFKSALSNSDVLLPDGVGIVAAVKILTGNFIKKIAGEELHNHLLEKLNANGGSCFYLGSTDETLSLIKLKLNKQYPNIKTGFYSPPFKQSFNDNDNNLIINAVNTFKPDVLFVGMTAPKQEKWTYQFKQALDVTTICSIGAVFDFYAGTVNRPSKFWQGLGLEWFVRFLKEPRRMFKRYIYYGPVFVLVILKQKFEKLRSGVVPASY
jgi:N-acetylglucosaminyldiphosphoundecaprenol N-acetyl-beta-D-mannosaminyltransferase